MNMISLHSSSLSGVTVISNRFIDEYMPAAHGEYVKVYLYLLRILSDAPSFSLEIMADHLRCPEKDIFRALKYWESQKLLSCSYDKDGNISGITFCDIDSPSVASKAKIPQANSATVNNTFSETLQVSEGSKESDRNNLSADRIQELKGQAEIKQLIYIAEQYLGKLLSPGETQRILFFYDELHLPISLIEYLIEYCVSHNHKSFHYMEKVAMAWAKEGITTVEMAKNATARYGKEYFIVLKAMGITNRSPVDEEITSINRWIRDYGLDMDVILEACSRTVLQTGQGNFKYADKILSEWKEKKVRNLSDIRILDAEFKKKKLTQAVNKTPAPKTSSKSNKFNNFEQRSYDFNEYEKYLLNHQ